MLWDARILPALYVSRLQLLAFIKVPLKLKAQEVVVMPPKLLSIFLREVPIIIKRLSKILGMMRVN